MYEEWLRTLSVAELQALQACVNNRLRAYANDELRRAAAVLRRHLPTNIAMEEIGEGVGRGGIYLKVDD